MKKLIGLITVLLLSTSIFGQRGAELCDFSGSPATIVKQQFELDQRYLDKCTYSFWVSDTLFVLSYDPKQEYANNGYLYGKPAINTRNVYLYRLDTDGWKVASTLVKADYLKKDENDITSYDYIITSRRDYNDFIDGIGYSYVKQEDSGIVKIRLLNFYGDDKNNTGFNYRWDEVVFIPQRNGIYLAATITK